MKKIFVCSPLKATENKTMEQNIEDAKKYCKFVVKTGNFPYAPHVFFTQFLNDLIPSEREFGLNAGLEMLKMMDELWVFGDKISDGMSREIMLANEMRIPTVFVNTEKQESIEKIYKPIDYIKTNMGFGI